MQKGSIYFLIQLYLEPFRFYPIITQVYSVRKKNNISDHLDTVSTETLLSFLRFGHYSCLSALTRLNGDRCHHDKSVIYIAYCLNTGQCSAYTIILPVHRNTNLMKPSKVHE